jgi:hypothetical protein
MGTLLDVVLIVAGIIWSLIFLVVLVLVLVVFVLTRRYLRVAHLYLANDLPPLIAAVQAHVDGLSARTSQFAGRAPATHPPVARATDSPRRFSLPFLRRRRPWWQRLIGR